MFDSCYFVALIFSIYFNTYPAQHLVRTGNKYMITACWAFIRPGHFAVFGCFQRMCLGTLLVTEASLPFSHSPLLCGNAGSAVRHKIKWGLEFHEKWYFKWSCT